MATASVTADQRLGLGKWPRTASPMPRWKRAALKQARFRCERCGHYLHGRVKGAHMQAQGLVVHHRDGVTAWSGRSDNSLGNLKILCKLCHQIEHGFSGPRFTSSRAYKEQTHGRHCYFVWDTVAMRWRRCYRPDGGRH